MKQPVTRITYRLLPAMLTLLLSLPVVGDPETGVASWYGDPYHGRASADGEIYDMEKLTAAHPTLPFNTWVRVVNLENEKSVDLRITDRGPYIDGRIIDISRAAARAIGLIAPGTAQVSVEVISGPEALPSSAPVLRASLIGFGTAVPPRKASRVAPARRTPAAEQPASPQPASPASPQPASPQPSGASAFGVQAGAFRNRQNAERALAAMQSRYGSARLVPHPTEPGVWRVVVGAELTRDAADTLSQRIYEQSGQRAFVVRVDSNQ